MLYKNIFDNILTRLRRYWNVQGATMLLFDQKEELVDWRDQSNGQSVRI